MCFRPTTRFEKLTDSYVPRHDVTSAWTLIEMIGVLAVLTILAGLFFPAAIKHIDKLIADQEVATLKSFRDAFQEYVLTTRVIPDETTWYSAVASRMGVGTDDVLYNVRQKSRLQPRVFLIDPALKMGFGSATNLPYSQTNFILSTEGSPMQPISPRIMIVSSLGKALPSTVASGVFTSSNPQLFANLWNAADGTLPSDAAWSGWTGNAADVIVERINLSPLFVHLVLGKYNTARDGYCDIDGTAPVLVTSVDGYFLKGTVLTLYTNSTGMDTKQILTEDTSFVFEQGIWRANLTGASIGNGASHISDLVQQFLNATTNVNAANPIGNAQQVLVASDMLNYMSNYNVWAFSNNFNSGPVYTYLKNFEPVMMSDIQGLYQNAGGGNNYYPTNPIPCP